MYPSGDFVALAQETGSAPSLPALRRRSILIAALALLALGALSTALQAPTKAGGSNPVNPLGLIVGASLAALLFLSQEISALLSRSEREADERRLIEALDNAPQERPQAWLALIDALSAELEKTEKDRAVIVDDFDLLDQITRETLRHYLMHRLSPSYARELWVVFEDAELASLSKDLSLGRSRAQRSWRVRLEILRQTSLDERARRTLAEEVGFPEHADFRLVKSIAHSEAVPLMPTGPFWTASTPRNVTTGERTVRSRLLTCWRSTTEAARGHFANRSL